MIEYTVRVYDNGDKEWYLNGKRHREDGPAGEYANGDKFWYLDGKQQEVKEKFINVDNCWLIIDRRNSIYIQDNSFIESLYMYCLSFGLLIYRKCLTRKKK